jgi:hypothetical protein
MNLNRNIGILVLSLLSSFHVFSQYSTLRERTLRNDTDTFLLDSLSIYPNSFQLFCGEQELAREFYQLNHAAAILVLNERCTEDLRVSYRVLPMNLSRSYALRDTSMIYTADKGQLTNFSLPTRTMLMMFSEELHSIKAEVSLGESRSETVRISVLILL